MKIIFNIADFLRKELNDIITIGVLVLNNISYNFHVEAMEQNWDTHKWSE